MAKICISVQKSETSMLIFSVPDLLPNLRFVSFDDLCSLAFTEPSPA